MPSQVTLMSGEKSPWFQAKPGWTVTHGEAQLGAPANTK